MNLKERIQISSGKNKMRALLEQEEEKNSEEDSEDKGEEEDMEMEKKQEDKPKTDKKIPDPNDSAGQMIAGMKVEEEHMPTYRKLEKFIKENGRLPNPTTLFKSIASDHLKEHKDYYTTLLNAKL